MTTRSSTTIRPAIAPGATEQRRLLVIEDDPALGRSVRRGLEASGFHVTLATTGTSGIDLLLTQAFDAVVSDVALPEMTGIEVVRTARTYGIEVPVILMTGSPTVETAVDAVELGVIHYLTKPLSVTTLSGAVKRALARTESAVRRAVAAEEELKTSFERALRDLWLAFRPIAELSGKNLLAYEVNPRSHEASLAEPEELRQAADELGRSADLGARVRERVSDALGSIRDRSVKLFVPTAASDLAGPSLLAESCPLARVPTRIVFQLVDHGEPEQLEELATRAHVLRFCGSAIALGSVGSAGALDDLVDLEPAFVKLSPRIVKNIHDSRGRQEIVRALGRVAAELGFDLVAEGVDRQGDLDRLRSLGVRYGQGDFIGPASAALVRPRCVA